MSLVRFRPEAPWFPIGNRDAGVAHPVERHLAKVEVASSSLVTRSKKPTDFGWFFLFLLFKFLKFLLYKSHFMWYNPITVELARWCSRLARQPVTLEVDGSSPFRVAKKHMLPCMCFFFFCSWVLTLKNVIYRTGACSDLGSPFGRAVSRTG